MRVRHFEKEGSENRYLDVIDFKEWWDVQTQLKHPQAKDSQAYLLCKVSHKQ